MTKAVTTTSKTPAPRHGALDVLRAGVIALAASIIVLAAALVLGGAVAEQVIPGLGDAGTVTRWGLPLSRLGMNLTAAATIGLLLAATFLLPLEGGGGTGRRASGGRRPRPRPGRRPPCRARPAARSAPR